jgi:hypothetical protein
MKKQYIIEDNIDFYDEINNEDEIDYDNTCLITNEPLTDKFVTMECGHKFNYIPLYNDLFKQKYYTNFMEESKLFINQIRCPYCRNITNKLIPFYENFFIIKDIAVRKIIGVNNYHLNAMTKSFDHYSFMKEKILWEKEKEKINKYQIKEVKEHAKLTKLMVREAKLKAKEDAKEAKLVAKEAKLKAKEDAKEAKLKAKEDAKEAKLMAKEAKLKAKEAKLKAKENKKV